MENIEQIIEAILFAAGRVVKLDELMLVIEINKEDLINIIENMRLKFNNRGIEIVKVDDGYSLASKKEYHKYIYEILDKRSKPTLSQAALETLSIIAYNPKITRAQIEQIRGVSSDATIYRLLEYNLIEEAGKLDLPGRPMSYKVSEEFFKMFGFSSIDELPELPRYRLDENEQIVIDDLIEDEKEIEVPMPERDTQELEVNEEN